jgi:hypothetical protein
LNNATNNDPIIDRAKDNDDQSPKHDAPNQTFDPHAGGVNWRIRQKINPAVSQAQRHEQRGQHAKNEQHHERGRKAPAQVTDSDLMMRLIGCHGPPPIEQSNARELAER